MPARALTPCLVLMATTSALCLPPPASAASAAASDAGTTVGEIVVTAEKRESTVQKTPISITAITGVELQSTGVSTAQGLAGEVPGLSVASAGPGNAVYEIRGLAAPGGESTTIGFYLDETPITPPVGATLGKVEVDPDLYDLQRVEVLRGPQGTLYGAGSMGGTIRLITNPPSLKGFAASGQTIVGGTDGGGINFTQNAMVNVPLGAAAALRIVGGYGHVSGWIDRIVAPDLPVPSNNGLTRANPVGLPGEQVFKNVNDEDRYNVRASLLIAPLSRLTAAPSVFYQRTDQGGMNAYDSTPGALAHYEPFNIAEPSKDAFVVASLPITYRFDRFSVTSATAWWSRWQTQFQDATEQFQEVLGLPAFSADQGGLGPTQVYETDATRQFSQELRASSSGSGRLQWTIGGFFSQYHFGYQALPTSPPPGAVAILGAPLVYNTSSALNIRQEAVFGNASWQITRQLKLEAGLRGFWYHNDFETGFQGALFGNPPPAPAMISTAAASNSGVSPMFNLSWSPSEDLMLYAAAAKGYREGAGNFAIPTSGPPGSIGASCLADLQALGRSTAPLEYGPDSVWNYEVGEKGQFFDHRLTVNADVYYIAWSQIQSLVVLSAPAPNCNLFFTANGANAAVKGGELEVRAELARGLELTQNLGYAWAAYTTSFPASNITKGQRLLDVPNWTVNTLLELRRPVGRFTFVAIAQNSFVSSAEELTYQIFKLPNRDLLNFRFGLAADKWSVFCFVDNVFNKHYPEEYLSLIANTAPPYSRIATNQPLTAGIDLSYQF
ncbi:MAG TPA: TonB-dependent receptor [Caulobacteraceae bacterium]|nr:TonB-dependent receptor [Caulobacteraceae bacterium]